MKLPIGIQDFESLRIDGSEYIENIVPDNVLKLMRGATFREVKECYKATQAIWNNTRNI